MTTATIALIISLVSLVVSLLSFAYSLRTYLRYRPRNPSRGRSEPPVLRGDW